MSAGFRYTPPGGTTKTHVLAKPMKFEQSPSRRKSRWVADSLDYSAHEVISVASGRMEVASTLRFNRNAQDLIDMLSYAADGVVVTYYPDLAVNTGYALWLVDVAGEVGLNPQSGRWPLGDYEVPVRFRDASASGTSLEALFSPWLFRYEAGMAVPGAVFTRTGTASQIGQFGVLESVATGLPRDGHWPLVDGVRTPSLLLEGARTNSILQSEDFSNASWTSEGTPVVTANAAVAPDGTTTADSIQDDDGAGFEGRYQDVTVAGDSLTRVVSVFVRKQSSFTATVELEAEYRVGTSKAGQIQLNPATGETALRNSGNIAASGVEEIDDNWYRLWLAVANNGTGNTTLRARVRPAINATGADGTIASSATGTATFWGAQVEGVTGGAVAPSSYIATTTAAVTRNAETFYAPFTHAPQAMTVYCKFIERGNAAAANNLRLFQIGGATGTTDPRFNVYCDTGGDYVVEHDNGTTVVGSVIGAGPSYGDVVEIRAMLNADGSVTGGQSIASAAEVTNSNATTATLGSTWADTRLYLNSQGSSNQGFADLLSVKVASGTKTLAEMRRL